MGVLEDFISESDPDLLDAEKGDLIYAVEKIFRLDDEGAEHWVRFMGGNRDVDSEDFPDPRDYDAEVLEDFLNSMSSWIRRKKTNPFSPNSPVRRKASQKRA